MTYGKAIRYAQRWLALDPLHEPAHRELIRLYALDGDRAAALAQYRDCVRTLVAGARRRAGRGDRGAVRAGERGDAGRSAPASAPVAAAPAVAAPPDELPLVGRAVELAALRGGATSSRRRPARGDRGRGRDRQVAARARAARVGRRAGAVGALPRGRGGAAVRADRRAARPAAARWASWPRCRRSGWPTRRCSRPSSRGRTCPPPMEMSGPAAQARLLEAIAAVLGVARVVFVDDVHAADEATLDVLAYLGRRLRGAADAAAARVAQRQRPARAPAAAARGVGADARAARRGAGRRARALAGDRARRPDAVFAESEGLPLFVAEYLAALAEGGDAGARDARPGGGARGRARRDRAPAARDRVGDRALVLASRSCARPAAAATRRPPTALDELVGRGLVREVGDGYDFTHGKLRELVYEQTGRARRRLLHRRVAEALLRTGGAARPPRPRAPAGGRRRRGRGRAARDRRRARRVGAGLRRRAGSPRRGAGARRAPVHERMGDLRTLIGDYAGALASYETAAAGSRRRRRSRASSTSSAASTSGAASGTGRRRATRSRWRRSAGPPTRAAGAHPGRPEPDAAPGRRRASGRPSWPTSRARWPRRVADQQALGAGAQPARDARARRRPARRRARGVRARSLALAEELEDVSARAAALNNLALVAREAGELDRRAGADPRRRWGCARRRATATARRRWRTTSPTSSTPLGDAEQSMVQHQARGRDLLRRRRRRARAASGDLEARELVISRND